MTASGVPSTTTTSSKAITGPSPEQPPSSSSPKKPAHQVMGTPPQENQAPAKPVVAARPVVSSQRSRSSSAESAGDIIGDYALGETIGKGTFGKVKLGLHLITGEKVAVKILEKKRIVEVADVERVAREIKILKRNRHVNVIQLFEVIDSPERIFLIMEFVDGGEMFEYIVAHHRIREPEAVVLFQQIVDGLDYLHVNEITHRDLKPENLLLQSCVGMPTGMLVKIVDFGLSNTHDGGRLLRTACGSPCYAAPEMIQGKMYKGPMADIWSLGVVLFAMVCGFLPFEDSNTNLLYKKILSADYKMPAFLSPAVQDLIRRIFETNPEKRVTIEMIRQHPWFTSSRTAVPRAMVVTASYDDPRLRSHILSQLASVGMDPEEIEDALAHKAHNGLTAAFFLLYNKLLRVLKDSSTPTSTSHTQPQPSHTHSQPVRPQPPQHANVPTGSSAKSDGTPRRPEVTNATEEVRSTGIRTKEVVPVKAPSSTATIASQPRAALPQQQRRASDLTGAASSTVQVTRMPSQPVAAQPSPWHHATGASPSPAATPAAAQAPPINGARRPSSVRSGRNLVLLTNGTPTPVGASVGVSSTTPQRPQIPSAIMARPPSQGGTSHPRVSISNGMVALTPLFNQKRPDPPIGGRRQTIIDAKTSASFVPNALATALATASGNHAHTRRRVTQAVPSPNTEAPGLALPAATQTPHAPLVARLSAPKEDDTRTSSLVEAQQRIPPQRPHPSPPSTAGSSSSTTSPPTQVL